MHKNRRNRHQPDLNMKGIAMRQSILNDMEEIFRQAMAAGKFSIALRAKELIGREHGLFLPASQRAKVSFADLNRDTPAEDLDAALTLESEKRPGQDLRGRDKGRYREKHAAQ